LINIRAPELGVVFIYREPLRAVFVGAAPDDIGPDDISIFTASIFSEGKAI